MIDNEIQSLLVSKLVRTLELEPSLLKRDAVERVMEALTEASLLTDDLKALKQHLTSVSEGLHRRAVINPDWLSKVHDMQFYFFLVDAQPGWLDQLISQSESEETGYSQYILYGKWDSLIVLKGTQTEASEFLNRIRSTAYYDLQDFSSHNTLLFHRCPVTSITDTENPHDPSYINPLVDDYDTPKLKKRKEDLIREGVILGPAWQSTHQKSNRVSAYVGINLKGSYDQISNDKVLASLLENEVLRSSMVHLFEVDKGQPFQYFARLICANMEELDVATNAIGFTRAGRVAVDGNTFIVASGRHEFLNFRTTKIKGMKTALDLRDIERTAKLSITDLGEDAINTFNKLEAKTQLVILQCLNELSSHLDNPAWDEPRDKNIKTSIRTFTNSILSSPEEISLSGAVIEIATGVESYVKHAIRRIVESTYGRDYGRAQKELKLPTKDFRKLTLGKAVNAFHTLKEHGDFGFLVPALKDTWLQMLDEFTESRNVWAHEGVSPSRSLERVIEDGRRTIVSGIELIKWIYLELLPLVPVHEENKQSEAKLTLPKSRKAREKGVFLSYSTKDEHIAEKIASGLQALDFRVWYAKWSIAPGEFIYQKIEDGLAQNDILLILLSPDSVKSRWVEQELNTALLRHLSGQNVAILPVIVDKCEIPNALQNIKYIDLSEDYHEGFIQLIGSLKKLSNL